MPDEIKSDDPAPVAPPDMTRYYYPPGATEPVLRPEIAAAEAQAGTTAEGEPAQGPATLEKIHEAMDESSREEEEAE